MTNMTDLTRLLREGDPVQEDGQLGADDAQRMRRTVLASVFERAIVALPWRRPFALAAMAVVLVIIGATAGHQALRQRALPPATSAGLTPIDAQGGGDRRQLQFSTPGGTRIIWIFDENLRLQESMP